MENYEGKLEKLSHCILKDGFVVIKEEKPNTENPEWSDITYTISISTVKILSKDVEDFVNNLKDDIINQYHKEEVRNE